MSVEQTSNFGGETTFTADADYGPDGQPFTYRWYYNPKTQDPDYSYQLERTQTTSASTDTYVRNVNVPVGSNPRMRVDVARGEQSATAYGSVYIYDECPPGRSEEECNCPPDQICIIPTVPSPSTAGSSTAGTTPAEATPAEATAATGEDAYLPDGGRLISGEGGPSPDSLRAVVRQVEDGRLLLLSASEVGGGQAATIQTGDTAATESTTSPLPAAFALRGSSPNPAVRGQADIEFAVPEAAQVEIVLYNALGQEIRRVIDRRMEPGFHPAPVEADGLASGVYLYRMRTDAGFTDTGKLVVVK